MSWPLSEMLKKHTANGMSKIATTWSSLFQLLMDFSRSRPIPYMRRYIVNYCHHDPEVVTYFHTATGGIVVESVRPFNQVSNEWSIRPVPGAMTVVDWRQYLCTEMTLPALSEIELRQAIPYQLSTISPYNPSEICYCVRDINGAPENQVRLSINYSHQLSLTQSLPKGFERHFFPTGMVSEGHLWESLIQVLISHCGLSDEDPLIYIRSTVGDICVGLLNVPALITPHILKFSVSRIEEMDVANGELKALVAQVLDDSVLGPVRQAFVIGERSVTAKIVAWMGDEYELSVKGMALEDIRPSMIDRRLVIRKDVVVSPSYLPLLATGTGSVPMLEPKNVFQKAYLPTFVTSQLRYLGIFLLVLHVVVTAALQAQLYKAESTLDSIQSELVLREPAFKTLSGIKRHIERASKVDLSDSAIDVVYNIISVKPRDLYLSAIDYTRSRRVVIRGYSPNSSSPVEFVKALRTDSAYSSVELVFLSEKSRERASLVECEMEIILSHE